jgi:hypothetical protein
MLATGLNPYINSQGFASTGMLIVLPELKRMEKGLSQ